MNETISLQYYRSDSRRTYKVEHICLLAEIPEELLIEEVEVEEVDGDTHSSERYLVPDEFIFSISR